MIKTEPSLTFSPSGFSLLALSLLALSLLALYKILDFGISRRRSARD